MAALKEKIYWNLPYFLKTVLASAHARSLDRQRFGSDYDSAIREIAEHDKWSRRRFCEYQNDRLRLLIDHAAKNVPYYRELLEKSGIEPSRLRTFDDLRQLPILDKQTVRRAPQSFVDETIDPRQLIVLHTSGTTGTPLRVYRDRALNSAALAYFDARCHAVAGMRRRVNKSVSVGGFLVAAPTRTKPPFWVENRCWKQLYMSSYHLAPDYLPHYVDMLRDYRADYMEGYASSVYAIARHIVDNKLSPVVFKACFTTADKLYDHYRLVIEKAFQCKVYDQYGCGEMAVFAAQCRHGSMHLSPETGYVEVLDDADNPLEPGRVGNLICTSLINFVQPFIRYRVGDRGSLKPGDCPCASPLPMLGCIEGRDDAVLLTPDGRRIGRLDPVFKGVEGIAEAQIVQNDYDAFVVRIVPGADYSQACAQKLIANLKDRLGDADIAIEICETIERTPTGKFRSVVNNIKVDATR